MTKKHRKGCTFGWDGSCVIGCPYHPTNDKNRRLDAVREYAGVETKFIDRAKARGWKALKFVSPGLRGVPDRAVFKGLDEALTHFMVWGGYTDRAKAEDDLRALLALVLEFAELKRPGKKATFQQLTRHGELDKLGFRTSVVDSPDAVEEWYANRS